MDFADDEQLAASMARVSSTKSHITEKVQDLEETVKILIEQIDNHMADFDGHSEEISMLRSMVDEHSENTKDSLTALDEAVVRCQVLEDSFKIKADELNMLTARYNDTQNELQLCQMQIRGKDHNLEVLHDRLTKLTNTNDECDQLIAELNHKINIGHAENTKLTQSLQVLHRVHKDEMLDVWKNMPTLSKATIRKQIFAHRMKNICQNRLQAMAFPSVTNERAVVPYTGNIESWDLMVLPKLKK